jgi:single-stranded-DNA-specific exonuclease
VGLVAGKLVDRYYRPSVVVEIGEEESRGSARSIPEFNITQALDEVREFLVRHGGHSRAAGFTVRTEHLDAFVDALGSVAERELVERESLLPTLEIDAEIDFDEINWTALEQLARLEPTGHENPTPLLMCSAMRVRDVRTVGNGKHLRMVLDRDQGSTVVDAVGFGSGHRSHEFAIGERIDAVFQIEANEWQGQRRLQVNLQDIRASQNYMSA